MVNDSLNDTPISVVIPVFNGAEYVRICVNSLLRQTIHRIEYIFVDDCSDDGSLSLLEDLRDAFSKEHQIVKIVKHPKNLGSAAARNTGLAHATGEYVGWVDIDDWVDPNMFKSLYYAASVSSYDLITCDYVIENEHDQEIVMQDLAGDRWSLLTNLLRGHIEGMLWNKIFRRSIIVNHDLKFNEGLNMAEDRNFLFKFLCYSNTVAAISIPFYHYVQTNQLAMTRNHSSKRVVEEINNDKNLLLFIEENAQFNFSSSDLLLFKFNSKKRLLFSTSLHDFKQWALTFDDCNVLWRSRAVSLPLRHRLLAGLASIGFWLPIQIWLFAKVKRSRNFRS